MTTQQPEIPANHIDLDSEDTKKLLEQEFAKAMGQEVPNAPAATVATETPAVVEDKPIEVAKTETPVVEVTKTETPVVANKEATTNEPAKTDTSSGLNVPEWAKSLDPELQKKIFDIGQSAAYHEQKWRSDVGRQNALQQKLLEARRRIGELEAVSKKPQDPDIAAAAQGDQSKSLEYWNQLIKADQNLATAVSEFVRAEVSKASANTDQKLAQVKATVDPLYQHTEQSHVEEQRRILQDNVPNYQQVVSSPVYQYWFSNHASPGIQNLARSSVEAADAINVLRMYADQAPVVYQEMVQRGLIKEEPQVQTTTTQARSVPAQDTALADKVAKTREDKVTQAPVVTQAVSPVVQPNTATSLANSKPGQQVDLDDATVQALIEAEFKKHVRR